MENEADYLRGKLDTKNEEVRGLRDTIDTLKSYLGWAIAGLIILGIVFVIVLASVTSHNGYSPQECAGVAIQMAEAMTTCVPA